MPVLNPIPLINGRRWDYGSIEVVINGNRASAVKAISYSRSLKPGQARGTGPRIIGTTRGTAENEGSMELYKDDFSALIALLGPGYGERYFDVVVTYGDDQSPQVSTDVLRNCRITKAEDSHSAGEEPLVTKCDLFVGEVIENGLGIVSPAP